MLLRKAERVSIDCSGDRDEFNHIDATLAAFHFGNEGLRLPEPVGELLLDQVRILPSRLQQSEQTSVIDWFDKGLVREIRAKVDAPVWHER
jgi:hypothetical protein